MTDIDKQSDIYVTKSDINVNYLSIAEAAKKLGVSERTVYRRIDKGEIPIAIVGDKRMILAHALTPMSEDEDTQIKVLGAQVDRLSDEVSQLKAELEHKDRKLDEKDEDLRRKDEQMAEASQRHDTIVLQLTRQLEQSQRLLEFHQDPWYRRWFRKDRRPGGETGSV